LRIAVYYGINDIRVEEMPVPDIGPGELLVRVEASGICGSDVVEWYRRLKTGQVQGHEIAGQIVAVGQGVSRYQEGDRVFVYHHVPCNTCHRCLNGHHTTCETFHATGFHPGGFAEFVRVPAINVERGIYLLPEHVLYEEGTFVEPLACAVRGMRLAHMQAGKSVLVLGSGIVGLLHVQLARALAASRVVATDVSDYRLDAARRFGADLVWHAREYAPERLRDVNDGRLADLVVTTTGALPALQQALQSVEPGGTILFFALTGPDDRLPISVNDLLLKEITFTGSYSGSPQDARVALELIRNRSVRVAEMITHRLSLAEIQLGYQLVAQARDSIKVIIEPQR
jgi:L-iditol 2-dehydrogenase